MSRPKQSFAEIHAANSFVFQEVSLNDMHHNLIGSFQDLVHSKISKESLDRVVLEVAISTVELQRIIDNVKALICRKLLGHSAIHS